MHLMAMRSSLTVEKTPPLENGDFLTRDEFERRYEASPHIKKAELIDGVVFVASPVYKDHSGPHFKINTWLGVYASTRAGVEGHDNQSVRLGADDELQPDLLLRYVDGLSTFNDEGLLAGTPELVIEVAASSASLDMHAKRRAYERAGVPEYLVWRTLDRRVDWFVLREGKYVPIVPRAGGVMESTVFPGLRLSESVLVEGSLSDLLALLS
jgi:Uma2 family endonuclease